MEKLEDKVHILEVFSGSSYGGHENVLKLSSRVYVYIQFIAISFIYKQFTSNEKMV